MYFMRKKAAFCRRDLFGNCQSQAKDHVSSISKFPVRLKTGPISFSIIVNILH